MLRAQLDDGPLVERVLTDLGHIDFVGQLARQRVPGASQLLAVACNLEKGREGSSP